MDAPLAVRTWARTLGFMMIIRTHYDSLQVTENASPEVIRGAYRYLSKKWHPDKNPDNTAEAARTFSLINEAYAVLSDPQRRKEYDLWIKSERERDAERITKDQLSPTPRTSKEAPIMVTTSETGVVKRVWLMVLKKPARLPPRLAEAEFSYYF